MNPTDVSIAESIFKYGPGLLCAIALALGAAKKWCFYYQLEHEQAAHAQTKKDAEARRLEDSERFKDLLRASEDRSRMWQKLLIDWEHTTKTTVDVAKQIAAGS